MTLTCEEVGVRRVRRRNSEHIYAVIMYTTSLCSQDSQGIADGGGGRIGNGCFEVLCSSVGLMRRGSGDDVTFDIRSFVLGCEVVLDEEKPICFDGLSDVRAVRFNRHSPQNA